MTQSQIFNISFTVVDHPIANMSVILHINGFMQERRNSIFSALELVFLAITHHIQWGAIVTLSNIT